MARALDGRRTPGTLRPPSARAYRANVGYCVAFLALVLVVPPPSDLQAQVRTETRRVVQAEERHVARLERAAIERLQRDNWEVPGDTRAVIRDVAWLGLDIAEITREDAVDPTTLEARFVELIDSVSRTLRRSGPLARARVLPRNEFAEAAYGSMGIFCRFWPFCVPRPPSR
jgi:hypothetical protein